MYSDLSISFYVIKYSLINIKSKFTSVFLYYKLKVLLFLLKSLSNINDVFPWCEIVRTFVDNSVFSCDIVYCYTTINPKLSGLEEQTFCSKFLCIRTSRADNLGDFVSHGVTVTMGLKLQSPQSLTGDCWQFLTWGPLQRDA